MKEENFLRTLQLSSNSQTLKPGFKCMNDDPQQANVELLQWPSYSLRLNRIIMWAFILF